MAIESSALRNMVQASAAMDTPVDLRAGKDLPAQSHSRFSLFRSGAEKSANQAQFQSLRSILAGDPTLMTAPGAARAAYAAISKAAESGAPLTARLVAKAYSAGDAAVSAHRDAMEIARGNVLGQGVRALQQDLNSGTPSKLLPDDARLRGLLDPALPASTRNAVAAVIMDQARADLAELGHHFDPAVADAGKLMRSAAAKSVDAIAAILAKPPSSPASGSVPARIAPLVDELQTFSQARMSARLYSPAGANTHFEQEVGRVMQGKLAAMSNESFLPLYKNLQSADLMEFRLQLATAQNPGADQMLADLNSWEGQVHEEMARRIELGAGPGLSGNNLAVLGDVERSTGKEALARQSDAWLAGTDKARTATPEAMRVAAAQGVSLDTLQQTLHSAELTINVPFHLFASSRPGVDGYQTMMGEGGKIMPERLALKNVFDFGAAAKGADYIERRQAIEHAQFGALAKLDAGGLSPRDHPISAAVNFGRSTDGAGGTSYGTVVLVLKPEVRDRCTYTARDSFYSYEARIDQAGSDRFRQGLGAAARGENPLVSPKLAERLSNDPALVARLTGAIDTAVANDVHLGPSTGKSLEDFVFADLISAEDRKALSDDDGAALFNLAIKSFVDPEASRAHVATRDHLDKLFGAMKQDTLSTLKGAADPLRVNGGGAYVEAQVWGGIDLLRDVAEIRFPDLERGSAIDGNGLFAMTHGHADSVAATEAFYQDGVANLQSLGARSGIKTSTYTTSDVDTRRLATDATAARPFALHNEGAPAATRAGGLTAFKATHLPALLDKYRSHEETFDPEGLHGRRHVSRALLYANVLGNVVRAQGATIDSHALYTTTVLHDAGREGNGIDKWEADSAGIATQALTEMGVTDPSYLSHAAACVNSKAPSKDWTIERGLLKSADSLDIMRVTGRDGFKPEFLWFMNQDVQLTSDKFLTVDASLRGKLIDEVASFIEATEPTVPSEAAYARGEQELQALSMLPGSAETLDRMTELLATQKVLKAQVQGEHRALNAGETSADMFDRLEAELVSHPEKYPTLHQYYDPTK
jgi:hypothetical protein